MRAIDEIPQGYKRAKILLATILISGGADILLAFANAWFRKGVSPERVLRFIASGYYGMEAAFSGGPRMILLGLFFHFSIAGFWVYLYFRLHPKRKFLNPYLSGILYGALIWLVMNLVVLPFSNIPATTGNIVEDLIGALILIIAIGLPVALIHHYFLMPNNKQG